MNIILFFLNLNAKRNCRFEWCKSLDNARFLPFDFCIEELKLLIELDGEQHFTQISNWNSAEKTRKNDNIKMQKANENGYSVIRVLWSNVYYNIHDWKENLMRAIKFYDIPGKIYLDDRYKDYY